VNTFNRFLVILVALAGICFSLAAVLAVWAIPSELGASLRQTSLVLRDNPILLQGLVTALAVSFVLVALLILVGEFSPQTPAAIPLAGVTGGGATVAVATVTERIKSEVEQVSGVRMARPRVRPGRGAVDVVIEVRSDPDVHLPSKAAEVVQVVRSATEERLGVQVRNIRVNFQPDSGRGAPARPQGDIRVPGASTAPGPSPAPGLPESPPAPGQPTAPPDT